VVIRKPIMQRWRKKKRLVQIVSAEALTHIGILKRGAERSRSCGIGPIYPQQTPREPLAKFKEESKRCRGMTLERNQSPYILMILVKGRHSLVRAST
jgi:hypothetical protein